jgi:hypothetical protein
VSPLQNKSQQQQTYKRRRRNFRQPLVSSSDRIATQGTISMGSRNPFIDRGPFPPEIFTKHRYSENITLTTGTAGIYGTIQTYRLNSLYDPNLSGTGHQPYGFDEVVNIYGRYCVTDVEIQLTLSGSQNTNNTLGYLITPAGYTFNMAGLDAAAINEIPGGGTLVGNVATTAQAQATAKLGRISLATVEGRTKAGILGERDYSADYTTSPVISPILSFGLANSSSVGGTASIVTVTFVFHCRWNHRRVFNQS